MGGPCAAAVVRQATDEPRDRPRDRVPRAVEHALGCTQDAADVARAPRVCKATGRRLRTRCDEQIDVGIRYFVARCPRRELLDLPGELVEVVADEFGEPPAGLGLRPRLVQLELVGDPAVDRL